jgi:hypothetical protein
MPNPVAPRRRSSFRQLTHAVSCTLYQMCPLSLFLLPLSLALAHARRFHLPEDTYAFPKYRVAFLDNLPLRNDTAQTWIRDGLRGGEREFLDQHSKQDDWNIPPSSKEIGSGDNNEPSSSVCTIDHAVTRYSPFAVSCTRIYENA